MSILFSFLPVGFLSTAIELGLQILADDTSDDAHRNAFFLFDVSNNKRNIVLLSWNTVIEAGMRYGVDAN